jgi:hypothetical protein
MLRGSAISCEAIRDQAAQPHGATDLRFSRQHGDILPDQEAAPMPAENSRAQIDRNSGGRHAG